MVDVGKSWLTYVVNGLGLQLNAKLPRWSVSLTPRRISCLFSVMPEILCLMNFSDVNSVALFAAFRVDSAPEHAPEIVDSRVSTLATWFRVFHSRVFHPCYLMPRFPLPRFQSTLVDQVDPQPEREFPSTMAANCKFRLTEELESPGESK